ncbi:unnamed protein product [Rotaria socialis]|uniref:CCHC-type domain-containing protein n=1 Tax=Rotaria socialis TaxID=392032 RepID=A0A818UX08_9BILA|nr:unnamed protein product [Rotaria socialis]CAF4868355.1 unnamed protein product [Rotaria socialis]
MDEATKQLIKLLSDNLAEQKAANKTQADLLKKLTETSTETKQIKFKVIEPLVYSLESTINLQDFFTTFEKYCAAQYGCADRNTWSAALGKFLEGDISKAYIGLEGGNLPWDNLKITLTARFADSVNRTKRFLCLFNNIVMGPEENLLDLSMRVEKLARQAYPTFSQNNLDTLIKEKYLAVVPEDVADRLSIAMVDRDLASTTFEKIVSLAERVQKLAPKTNIVEVARAANTVVLEAAGPVNIQAQATSFRPNGGNTSTTNTLCSHCNKPGHAIDRCWTLHPTLKPARRGNYNTNQGSYSNTGNRGSRGNFNNRGNFTAGARRCYSCGDSGHLANACTRRANYANNPPPINLNRAVNTAVTNIIDQCIVCGAEGPNFHDFIVCPVRIRQVNRANATASQTNQNNLPVQSLND